MEITKSRGFLIFLILFAIGFAFSEDEDPFGDPFDQLEEEQSEVSEGDDLPGSESDIQNPRPELQLSGELGYLPMLYIEKNISSYNGCSL